MKSLASRRQMMKTVPPDPNCAPTLESMRQNPKFARLLGFSVNNLSELLKTINPKHRVNAYFIMQEKGHQNLVQALKDHKKNESLVYSVVECLVRIITSSKQFQEEYCFKIVEVGAPLALHELINTINKNSEAMRMTIPFIGHLAASRANVQQLIEAGLMDDCVNIIKDASVDEDISRAAMETLIKFTSHPKAKQELIKPGFVKSIIDLIEQRIRDKNTVLAGLRILLSVLSINEGYELLKADSLGTKIIVKVLENHPEDRSIANVSANALEKLATIEDIENALNAVKAGNTSQVPLLSALLLVEDLLRYVVNKGGILDLITVMEKQLSQELESVSLVKSCATALGRIATSDAKYINEIFQHNGLETINKAFETENSEIVQACCDTIQKFSVDERTTEEIVNKGTVRALIDRFQSQAKSEAVCQSMVEALGAFGRFEAGRKEVVSQKGPHKTLTVIKDFKNKKEVQEGGIRALSKLITDAYTAVDLIEDGVIDHLAQITKANPQWRKLNLHTVKVFESVCQLGTTSNKLDKEKVFEVLVDIVTTGVTEEGLAQSIESTEKSEQEGGEKPAAKENKQSEDKLTEKQELELRNAAVSALQEITSVDDVHEMKISLEDASIAFAKAPEANAVKALQKQLKIFSTVALLPKIAELLITGGIPEKIARNCKIANVHPAFPGKPDIIKACTMFFEHLAHHGHNQELHSLLTRPNVKQAGLETMMVGLNKDTDGKTALRTMKAGTALVNARILDSKDKFACDQIQGKTGPKGDKEASAEKFIGAVLSTIKKFEDEEIQIAGINLLTTAANMDKGFIQYIIAQGGTRLAVSNLESMNTTLEMGKLNLQLITAMLQDPEAVKLLKNQNAGQAIMSFLSANHNPEEVAKLVGPILETLAADHAEQEIEEILGALEAETDDQDRLLLAETLEHVANLTLTDKNNELFLKKNALPVLLNQLKRELGANVETLTAQGVLEIHQRAVNALLSSIVRIRAFANQNPETNVDDLLIQENILDSLATVYKTRPDFMQSIANSLLLTTSFHRNQNTSEQVLQKSADSAIVSALTSFLETYKNEETIINNATELLLAISNKFPDLVSKMGQKSFVRALIKETKTALKLGEDDPSALSQAHQNLRCLVTMADNPNTLTTIIEEGGQDLSLSVVDKYIKENKKNAGKTEDSTSPSLKTAENLVSSSIELLDKILEVPKDKRAAVSSSVPNDLLNILEDCHNPEIGLNALKIVEKASRVEDFAEVLSENEALEKIMGSISTFPENHQVAEIVGKVITNLGANAMIPQVAEQVIELAQSLNMQDAESVESLNSALAYYSNLLAAPRDPEVEGDSSKRVSEAIQNSLEASKSDADLLSSHVKILEKLSTREPEVRTQIRESATSRTLVSLLGEGAADKQNQVLKVVSALSSSVAEPTLVIDGQTGEERLRKEEGDGFLHSFILNEGAPIEKLLQALQQSSSSSEVIVDALTLLNEVTTNNEKAKNDVIRQNGTAVIVEVFQNRLTGPGVPLALRVLSNLTHDKEAYQTIVTDNLLDKVVRELLEFKYEPVIQGGTKGISNIEAGLILLTNLSDNTFDHVLLKEKKCPDAVLGLLEKFRHVSRELIAEKKDTEGLNNSYKVVSHAMRALRKMFNDALIGRSLLKTQGKEHVLGAFNVLVETTTAPEEVDAEKLAQLTEISAQPNPLNQAIQDSLAVIETIAAHSKFGKELSLLDEESTLYQDILTLMSNIPDDSAASYRTLQISKHTLQALGKEKILENLESLSPLSDVADTLNSLYTNIPIIIAAGEDVKSLATTGLTVEEVRKAEEEARRIAEEAEKARIAAEEEARRLAEEAEKARIAAEEEAKRIAALDAQKAAEERAEAERVRAEQEKIRIEQERIRAEEERIRLEKEAEEERIRIEQERLRAEQEKYDNTIRQAKEDFAFLADLLEELIPKALKSEATEKDQKLLLECSEILKEHVRQEDKVAKVEQHDLIAPLSQVLSHADLNRTLKDNIAEVFSVIANNTDQSLKLAASAPVIHSLAEYIKQTLGSASGSADDSHEVRCIIGASETLEKLIEVARITTTLPQEVKISELTSNVAAVVEPACNRKGPQVISSVVTTLATLATLNEESAQVIETSGAVEKIMESSSKFDQDAKFARSYALLIASNATSQYRRTNYAQRGVFDHLHNSTQKFSNDLELGLNSCLAFTSLITGHPENVKIFVNSPSIQNLGKLLAQFPEQAMLVETIARLLNTVTSNYPESAEKLGEIGAAEWLTNLFKTEFTQEASVIECLKAVKNLLTTKENASRFIDQNFVPALKALVEKHSSLQVGLLALSILGSLATLSDADKTAKAIEQGSIDIISKLTSANQTDRTILVITTDNLQHFAKDQACTQLVAQKGGLDMTLKILTTQDFDTELIQKSLDLLNNMLGSPETINAALEADTLSILNNLISTQRKSPQVLTTIFQIIEKLSTDHETALKIYQSGFLQAAFKAAEEGSLDQNTTHALHKGLLKLSQSEDVAALIGETGSITILRQLEANVESQHLVDTATKLTVNLLEAESNVDVIVNNRGVEILNSIMEKYPEDERIAVQVYKALSLIAVNSDQMRPEMVSSDMKHNVEEMQKYFQAENKTEPLEQIQHVIDNLNKAAEIQKEHDEQNKPVEEEPVIEAEPEKAEEPAPAVVEEEKKEDANANLTPQQKKDKTLNLVKNDPQLKEAWAYIFRGKILKFWTPHGTNWPMHLLLTDDGFGLVLRGKKKWETSVRLDDIDGIWKGFFPNSPFTRPQKLFTKVPSQDLCFFFNTFAESQGGVRTFHFECQNTKEREAFVDFLVQILRRLKVLVQEQREQEAAAGAAK